jgi:hypothetical protein
MGIKYSIGDKDENGKKAVNFQEDVALVRQMLNFHIAFATHKELKTLDYLPGDGIGDMAKTILAIRTFQIHVLKLSGKTGRIEPNDRTIKELLNISNIMEYKRTLPEIHADNKALTKYKLTQALYSEEIEYMDLNGETKCLIELLLKPNVDDNYIPPTPGVTSAILQNLEYINNAPPDRPPPPPETVTLSLLSYIELNSRSKHTISEFIKMLITKQCEIEDALNQFRLTDDWTRNSFANEARTIGPGAAYRKLMVWFIDQRLNKNSIYSCVGQSIDETK